MLWSDWSLEDLEASDWLKFLGKCCGQSSEKVRRRLLAATLSVREDLNTDCGVAVIVHIGPPAGVRNRKSMQRIEHLYPAQPAERPRARRLRHTTLNINFLSHALPDQKRSKSYK